MLDKNGEWDIKELGCFYRNTSTRFRVSVEKVDFLSKLGAICYTAGQTEEYLGYFHDLNSGIGAELFNVLEDYLSIHDLQSIAYVFTNKYNEAEAERQERVKKLYATNASDTEQTI